MATAIAVMATATVADGNSDGGDGDNYCGSGGNGDSDCGDGDSNGSSSGDGDSDDIDNGGNNVSTANLIIG